jgi:hypothetical protein
MSAKTDNLVAAVAELEHVLDETAGARGPDQSARLGHALGALEEAARRHARVLHQPDGLVGAVDRPRLPSPAVDRETAHLAQELDQLLHDIRELRGRAPQTGADHAALFRRARQLAEALERFEAREAHLILESINLDLGAGD